MKSVSPSLREVRRKCGDDPDNSLELSNRNHLTLGPNTSVLISNPAIHTQDKDSEHQNETIVLCATLLTEHKRGIKKVRICREWQHFNIVHSSSHISRADTIPLES